MAFPLFSGILWRYPQDAHALADVAFLTLRFEPI
jgi:hypothetical protein